MKTFPFREQWNSLGIYLLVAVSVSVPMLCFVTTMDWESSFLLTMQDHIASCKTHSDHHANPLKRIVIAAHYEENVSWLDAVSRYWQVTIMGPGGLLANKGNEAMAYLTYIIQNYEHLPESMAFIHGHQTSWHAPRSQLETLLKIPCWEKVPYASITSSAFPGIGTGYYRVLRP